MSPTGAAAPRCGRRETRFPRVTEGVAKLSWNCVLTRYSFERTFGTQDALRCGGASPDAPRKSSTREALIRTLGVSLVAVAAIVASLTLVRQSHEVPVQRKDKRPEHSPAAVDLDLEQLRAAGF